LKPSLLIFLAIILSIPQFHKEQETIDRPPIIIPYYAPIAETEVELPNPIEITKPELRGVVGHNLLVWSVDYTFIKDRLTPGDEVAVLKERGDLLKVLTPRGVDGWVDSKWVWIQQSPFVRDEPLPAEACKQNCWVTNETWFTPAPQHTIGKAVYYAPHVMEGTANSNGMSLDGFAGGVAMQSCADIGQIVWLRNNGGAWEGPYLVVDCSARNRMWEHSVIKEQSVEVDFDTALRWGMVRLTADGWKDVRGAMSNIEVWKGLLPPDDPSEPIPYMDFFLGMARLGGYNTNQQWSPVYAEFMNYGEYLAALQ